jgi:predicted esterase
MPGNSQDLYYQIAQSEHLPPFLISNGDADPVITSEQASRLHQALKNAGADSRLTIVLGAGHEDPLFRETQMAPTFNFLIESLRNVDRNNWKIQR